MIGYTVLARSILIAHTIFKDVFQPENPEDLQYLWDVWNSFQWTDTIRKRFLKDLNYLLVKTHTVEIIQEPFFTYTLLLPFIFFLPSPLPFPQG